MFQEETFAVRLSKDVSYNMKTADKTFSCPWLFINPLVKKRIAPLGKKTHASVVSLLMENKVWEILIAQICIDFHDWKIELAQENYC